MFGRLYFGWLFGSCPVFKRAVEASMYRTLICLVYFFLFLTGSLCVHLQAQETTESEGGDPSVVTQDDGTVKPFEDDTELVLAKKVTALVQEGEARDALELIGPVSPTQRISFQFVILNEATPLLRRVLVGFAIIARRLEF